MINDVLSEAVLVATVLLVAMPLVAHNVRQSFRPIELTRFNASTLGGGLLLLGVALVACATPVLLAVSGSAVADRHFFPGDSFIGWVSAATVAALVAVSVRSFRHTKRVERQLTIEPSIGLHVQQDPFTLVVLDSDEPLAYAVNDARPQVVITSGLVDLLEAGELAAVVEHEAAHLALNHRIHLRLIGILEPLGRVRPVGRLIEAARLALELAADSKTSDKSFTRSALLRTAGIRPAHGVAAFTAGDLVARIEALEQRSITPRPQIRLLLYSVSIGLASLSATTLIVFWL